MKEKEEVKLIWEAPRLIMSEVVKTNSGDLDFGGVVGEGNHIYYSTVSWTIS